MKTKVSLKRRQIQVRREEDTKESVFFNDDIEITLWKQTPVRDFKTTFCLVFIFAGGGGGGGGRERGVSDS